MGVGRIKRSVIFLIFSVSVYAQVEWFPVGAEWNYESGSSFPVGPVFSHHFVVEKDTTVDGKACRFIKGDSVEYVVYEDNGCVYYHFNGKFRKCYDFNVQEGDTVELEWMACYSSYFDTTVVVPCRVENVTKKMVGGVELKEVRASYFVKMETAPRPNPPGYPSDDVYYWYDVGTVVYLEKIGLDPPKSLGGSMLPYIAPEAYPASWYHILIDYREADLEYVSPKYTDWLFPLRESQPNEQVHELEETLTAYPNPVKGRLTIADKGGNSRKEVSVQIYNMVGKAVLEKKTCIPCELDVEHLIPGSYLIRILDGAECLISKKLIVR